MDGPDALSVPILAMTANAFSGDIGRSLEAGMNSHIPRTIDVQQMYQAMQEWL